MAGVEAVSQPEAFRTVEDLVGSWDTGLYEHHTQLRQELVSGGVEFSVTFSLLTPKVPIPTAVAHVTILVEPTGSTG